MRFTIAVFAAMSLAAGSLTSCGPAPLTEAAVRGREVFLNQATPRCGQCHILEHAGAKGVIGPNLDTMALSKAKVLKSIIQGVGVMPSQKEKLTKQQIDDVATYVMEAAGRGPSR